MTPHTNHIEPITVSITLLGLVFSPEVSALLGPYLVIIMGAIIGAFFRISQRPDLKTWQAAGLFVVIVMLACMITVPICNVIETYFKSVENTWLFAPVSLAIGIIGEQWPDVLKWAGGKINNFIDTFIRRKGGD